MYKPLPDSLTILPSGIDGLGLFAKKGLAQGTNLGRSHMKIGASRHTDTDIPEGLIRAALAIKYKDLNPTIYSIKV